MSTQLPLRQRETNIRFTWRHSALRRYAVRDFGTDKPLIFRTIVRNFDYAPHPEQVRSARASATERLRDEVTRRYPSADALDAALLVESLMSGIVVIADHWLQQYGERPGAVVDDESRAAWDALLSRLVHSVRSGYMPTD